MAGWFLLASAARSLSLKPVRLHGHTHSVLQRFQASLSASLQRSKHTRSSPYLHLTWLLDAMAVVLSTHSSIQDLLPLFQEVRISDKVLEQYMDDHARLLDICNDLKEVTADIERSLMLVRHALSCIQPKETVWNVAKLMRARNSLSKFVDVTATTRKRSRLQASGLFLQSIGYRNRSNKTKDVTRVFAVLEAMDSARLTAVSLCGVLATTLQPRKLQRSCVRDVTKQSQATPCSVLLFRLHRELSREEIQRGRSYKDAALLQELETLNGAATKLHDLLNKTLSDKVPLSSMSHRRPSDELRCAFQALVEASRDLEASITPLRRQVEELFRKLIVVHVDLLEIVTHSRAASPL